MTDSLKEKLRGSSLELQQIARQDYAQENPETGDAFYSEGQSLMLAAAHIEEALARIEELEETYAATQLQIRLAYDKHDRDRATIAKLEENIASNEGLIHDLEARLVSNSEAGLRERQELRATIAKLNPHISCSTLGCQAHKLVEEAHKYEATIAKLESEIERLKEALNLCLYALVGADRMFNINAAIDKARAALKATGAAGAALPARDTK